MATLLALSVLFIYSGNPITGRTSAYAGVTKMTNASQFKAGHGWLKTFKDRHGIRAMSMHGEPLSAEVQDVDTFKQQLSKLLKMG